MSDFWEQYALSKLVKGKSSVLAEKTITANGVYSASGDNADGYSTVTVNVPNTYTASDEGKVVHDGALTAQTTTDITSNGVVDTTLINEVNVHVRNYTIYGFHIDPDESDPFDCVTYLEDAVGMTPASMGSTAFNYGSWQNVFFMPKPCMLKYDGTVDYYLDPNDFTKKVDGTASDVEDINYAGNAMMEFPKIWFKFEAGTADGECYFYVSNQKVDSSYKCWCNLDSDGNETDHFYMAIYNGTMPNGLSDKMRSLSGLRLTPTIDGFTAYDNTKTYAVGEICKVDTTAYECITAVNPAEDFDPDKWQEITPNNNGYTTGQQEVDAAVANDTTAKSEWYTGVWCDRVLINALHFLISHSLNSQASFGQGLANGSQPAKESYVTGSLNDKGLFYGYVGDYDHAVKTFGMENWWGCEWRRTAGLIGTSTGYKFKMTQPYSSSGTGYTDITVTQPEDGYISKVIVGPFGYLPASTTNGSSTTHYSDNWHKGRGYALVGGYAKSGVGCGCSWLGLPAEFSFKNGHISTSLSCKPLASKFV